MFDIGFTELMLIGIVSLVVIGPERLPAVAKTAGQWIAKLQRFVRGVKTDLASELETGDLKKLIGDQREQIDELRKMVTTAKNDFEKSTNDAVQDAKSTLNELETKVADSQTPVNSPDESASSSSQEASSNQSSSSSAAETQIETLDGKTVSTNDSGNSTDIGRTGS